MSLGDSLGLPVTVAHFLSEYALSAHPPPPYLVPCGSYGSCCGERGRGRRRERVRGREGGREGVGVSVRKKVGR